MAISTKPAGRGRARAWRAMAVGVGLCALAACTLKPVPLLELGALPATEALSAAEADALGAALALDRWLGAGTAYVVPSGDVYHVPWGALDLAVPVVVVPTGGWLGRAPPAIGARRHAAIVGDPDFGGSLPQLPGARAEAERVAQLYAAAARTGTDATGAR